MNDLKRTFVPLLLPLTAYTLFIQCGQWIIHYWVAINAVETFDYVINADILFFMCISLGVVVSSLLLDKYGETPANRNLGLASSVICAGIACLFMVIKGSEILIAVCAFGFFTGCIRPAIMVWFLRNVQYNERGFLLSLTVFVPRIVFDMVFIVLFPEMTETLLVILTISSVCMMVICLLPRQLVKYKAPEIRQEEVLPGLQFDTKALLCMIIIAFLLNMLVGILDMATTKPTYIPNAFVNFGYYTRFSSLFFMIPFGIMMGRRGRQSVLMLTPILLLLAMFAGLYSTSGIIGITGLCFMMIGSAALSMAVGLVFLDHAENTKRAALTASFGYVVLYVSRQIGTKVGLTLADSDANIVYTLGSLCGIAAVALIVFFYEHMRSHNVSGVPAIQQPETADREDFGFTLREAEVFRMILHIGTISEIANKMYLSEVTVKRHVTSILRKTKTKNRAELVNRFGLNRMAVGEAGEDKEDK